MVPQGGRKSLWFGNRFSMNPALSDSLYRIRSYLCLIISITYMVLSVKALILFSFDIAAYPAYRSSD